MYQQDQHIMNQPQRNQQMNDQQYQAQAIFQPD